MAPRESESVWDYPRPPIVVPDDREVVVEHAGVEIARSARPVRVLETSHPPTFYLPLADVADGVLRPSDRRTVCEFKGRAAYWDLVVGDEVRPDVAWWYPEPEPGYESLRGMVAFYPGRVDRCTVGGIDVMAQPGDFYGGWITPEIEGPFKGGPGTAGW